MNIKEIYKKHNAYLEGHFLLSSGKHSQYYLQSARVLEHPSVGKELANALAKQIKKSGIKINTVCSPALGGLIAGYELATALNVRFIFTERVNGIMTLKRGFEVSSEDNILICEDIITTGGSALESADEVERLGANVVAFGALANRGFCARVDGLENSLDICKLPKNKPLFALEDFTFEIYESDNCPLCADGSKPYKPGSRI
jgi:orotate phosphoribosyltransferase